MVAMAAGMRTTAERWVLIAVTIVVTTRATR
jgi:hypothetical protein